MLDAVVFSASKASWVPPTFFKTTASCRSVFRCTSESSRDSLIHPTALRTDRNPAKAPTTPRSFFSKPPASVPPPRMAALKSSCMSRACRIFPSMSSSAVSTCTSSSRACWMADTSIARPQAACMASKLLRTIFIALVICWRGPVTPSYRAIAAWIVAIGSPSFGFWA